MEGDDKGKCPTCGEDGAYLTTDNANIEQLHFLHRSLWDLHRLRQALELGGKKVLAICVSDPIRKIDKLARILLDRDH